MSRPIENNLERTPASAAFKRAGQNKYRSYPSPERGGTRLYPLASPQAQPSFKIDMTDKIFAIGSCFARNVEIELGHAGLNVTSNERDLGIVGDSRTIPSNFFNKYSIHSIYTDLKWALERETDIGDAAIYALHKPGMYADLQLGMPKLEFPVEDIRAFRSRYLDVMARVADADVIVITLGYVETWYDLELEHYLNSSPPQPLIKAHPGRFEFRVLSYQDVLQTLHDIHALLLKHRFKPLKMLLTVSPVPLLSTFRDMDVLVANTYSKSVQRAAIDEFIRDVEGVDYFPSYESVTLSNPDYVWDGEGYQDYRHVAADFVAFIMQNVTAEYMQTDTDHPARMTPKNLEAVVNLLHRADCYDNIVLLGEQHRGMFEVDIKLMTLLANAYEKSGDKSGALEVLQQTEKLRDALRNTPK